MQEFRAYAKINWTLDVLHKRPDGYHELDTLMQKVSLYDSLYYQPDAQLHIDSDMHLPEQNNMKKAADLYRKAANAKHMGARISVTHRIPTCAGLGGSSADAAGVLSLLQALYGALRPEQLWDVALAVGADVPFCLQQQPCRCRGVGERLTPFASRNYALLLVKPEQGVSTKALFSNLALPSGQPVDGAAAMAALQGGDYVRLGDYLVNALQPAAQALLPQIAQICARLRDVGAVSATMSGSGSCCYGVFPSVAHAQRASAHFADEWCQCVTTR